VPEDKGPWSSPPFKTITIDGVGDVVTAHGRLYVPSRPPELRRRLMELAHDKAGHFGIDKVVHALRHEGFVTWESLKGDVASYVDSCVPCQRFKAPHALSQQGHSEPTAAPHPFFTLYVDPFGPIAGKHYVFVIVDAFSRFIWFRAASSTSSAALIAALTSVTDGQGQYPRVLRVDSAASNVSAEVARWAAAHGIAISPSPPHAHWTLGTAESQMAKLRKLAQIVFGANGTGADVALASQDKLDVLAAFANNTVNRSIGDTPFHVFKGYRPDTALTTAIGSRPSAPFTTDEWLNRISAVHELAALASSVSQCVAAGQRDATRADPPVYNPQDLVLVWYPSSHKLEPFYRGPYVIDSRRDANWYKVRRLVDIGVADADLSDIHVSRLRRFNASRTTIPQLLAHGLDDDFGIVAAVLGHRGTGKTLEYEIRWSDDSVSFLAASSLGKVKLVHDYNATHGIEITNAGAARARKKGKGKRAVA
jgi:hypothetical protein